MNVTIGTSTATVDPYSVFHRLADIESAAWERFPDDRRTPHRVAAVRDGVRAYLTELGFGPVSCRAADRFCGEVAKRVAGLRSDRAARADSHLAYHYGTGVLALPSLDKLKLQVHLESVIAEEELRTTGGAGMSLDAFYDLVKLATGSDRIAERQTKARRAEMAKQDHRGN